MTTQILRIFILFVGAVVFSSSSLASQGADGSMAMTIKPPRIKDNEYPTRFRVTAIGGGVQGAGDHTGNGFSGGVFADYGKKWLSFEAGVQYMLVPLNVRLTDPNTLQTTKVMNMQAQYVGVPAFVKLNYIETPQAALSLKAGAMPAFLVSSAQATSFNDPMTGGRTDLEINQSEIFALGGFTGTAPISDWIAFVLDGTYYYGLNEIDTQGSHSQGITLGVGVRFSL